MNEITDASRRQAIADILDHHERNRGGARARRARSLPINDPQTIADILDILDYRDARRAAQRATSAVTAREYDVPSSDPAPRALLLVRNGGGR